MLVEVAADAQRALAVIAPRPELVADEAVGEAAGLLGEIVGQEFELTEDDERPRPRHGRRPRQIISAHDPEMRHGRKTNARRFTGYKLHVATAAQTPVLTAIAISPGNEHDGHHAAPLVEQQPASRRPERVIGDTAYGNLEVREQLEQRQTKVLAPLHFTRTADAGTIDKDEFTIDLVQRAGHLPTGQDGPDHQAPTQWATRRRHPHRALRFARLRALLPARALRSRRPPQHPHQPPRRPPPSRTARTRRPRPARSPQTDTATHRTAPRPDRLPLPRPHQPLQRRPQNRAPSRLDRHPGQPAPDRNRPTSPDPLATGPRWRPSPARKRQANRPKRRPGPGEASPSTTPLPTSSRPSILHTHAANDFFSGLPQKRIFRAIEQLAGDLEAALTRTGDALGRRWASKQTLTEDYRDSDGGSVLVTGARHSSRAVRSAISRVRSAFCRWQPGDGPVARRRGRRQGLAVQTQDVAHGPPVRFSAAPRGVRGFMGGLGLQARADP